MSLEARIRELSERHKRLEAAIAAELGPDVRFDLVVSDIHLPGLDGLGFRARLAERGDTDLLPFIFITATVPREMLNLPEGADRVIVRPIDNEMLLQEIRAVMRDRKDH